MRWGRFIVAALALAGLAPAGAEAAERMPVSPTAAAWAPNADDSWLFDVRSGQYRLGDGVRGYQTPQGICVDLGDVVLALDLAVRVDKKLRRATGWVFDERRSLTIDRETGEVRAGSERFRLAATTIRDTAAGWCVDLDSLNAWLGVPLTADLSNAVLRVDAKEKLPFQLAAERRARAASIRPQAQFDLATLPQAARPYQAWATPSVDVVASVGDGAAAVAAVTDVEPDIALLDVTMPEMDGIEATRRVVAARPETRVVILTASADREQMLRAVDAGALGYLLKDASPEELIEGVRAAARGESPLDPKVARELLADRRETRAPQLTDREREVLALVGEGLPNKLIARRLEISEKTVKAHLTRVYAQIGVTDRTQAALWARRHNIASDVT